MTEQDYNMFVKEYEKSSRFVEDKKILKLAEKEREIFLNQFPIEGIEEMPAEKYLFSKGGYDNGDTFCDLIFNNIQNIAHRGDFRIKNFGVYYVGGITRTISPNFDDGSGDFYAAYIKVRSEICNLLDAASRNDYKAIKNNKLYRPFKYRILAVYFPDKFLPVCNSGYMEKACAAMDIAFDPKEELIDYNVHLNKIKNSYDSTKCWHNQIFLGYCIWITENKCMLTEYKANKHKMIESAKKIEESVSKLNLTGEEKEAIVKLRINQSVFRSELLKRYKTCALCNVNDEKLLLASHIKPWAKSEPQERVDVDNGFMLCPNHDKLFDEGFISFDDEGKIMISDVINIKNRLYTNIREDMRISLTTGQKKYLLFHREKIFKG